jgi:hypothetical protein
MLADWQEPMSTNVGLIPILFLFLARVQIVKTTILRRLPSLWLKYFSMPKSGRLMEMTYRLRRRDQDEVGGDVNARGVNDKSVGGNAGNGGANLNK